MRQKISALLIVVLGAWVGGLVTLFIAVQAIFAAAPSKEVAGLVASSVFRKVEIVQLGVAAVAFLSAIIVGFFHRKSRPHWACAGLVSLAVISTCIGTFWLTPRIEAMRVAAETSTALFKTLHATSMLIYVGQTIILATALLWAAMLLSQDAIRRPGPG